MTIRNPLVLIPGGNPQIQELPAGDSIGGAAQGPVGMTWQGTWSSSTSYNIDDAVTYNGTSYIAIAASTNQAPPNATYWDVLASKGDTGSAATISVGTTTTGAAGSSASVTNSGSSSAAVFDFTIPQGATGATGANGTGIVMLEAHTASSGDAQMDFTTGISSTYDAYFIEVIGFQPATGSVDLAVRVMTGSPAAADTGNNYRWNNNRTSDGAANSPTGGTASSLFNVTGSGGNIPTTSTKTVDGRIEFKNPQSTSFHKRFRWAHSYDGVSNATISNVGGGAYQATTALTGIRLLFNSGNIAAGTARLYGISKT